MAEERLTDDPFGRKLEGDGEFNFEVDGESENYDDDLVGLTPSQLQEKLEERRRAEERAQKECERLLSEADENFAAENYAEAAPLYEQALLYHESEEIYEKLWAARTENYQNTQCFYVDNAATVFEEAPVSVKRNVLDRVGESLRAERAECENEAAPLREEVYSGMEARRGAFTENRNYYRIRFLISLALLVAFGIACAVSGAFIVRTRGLAAPVCTAVFGVLAFVSLVLLVIYLKKFVEAQKLVSANERLSATEKGARLEELEEQIAALDKILGVSLEETPQEE